MSQSLAFTHNVNLFMFNQIDIAKHWVDEIIVLCRWMNISANENMSGNTCDNSKWSFLYPLDNLIKVLRSYFATV